MHTRVIKDITSPTSDHLLRITQLEAELKREKKRGQDLEAELQQSIIESQSIQWHQVDTEINAELNALQRAGGIMSTGPVDAADPSSLTADFSLHNLHSQLLTHAPKITSLLSSIGQTDTTTGLKDIYSLAAVCLLAKKASDKVKGFQLLVSLKLVARATSKQVITTLNHMGVCLSYSQTFKYVGNAAKAIEQNRELQHGDWIVAYDNINIEKRVTHERHARHTEAWNFTSRLAVKVARLPPPDYNTTELPQCTRGDLAVEDILPNDDDDKTFHESAQTRVQKVLIHRFKCCNHLKARHQYDNHDHPTTKSIIHPIAVIDIDESYTDNNVTILEEFQKMLAIDDTVQQCVVGDQATCRAIRAARRRRVADIPSARLLWAKENPGHFHFAWECLKVIFLIFWESHDFPGSLAHLSKLINRSGVTAAAKKFQQSDEFLKHALEAHLTASLITFLNISATSDLIVQDATIITNSWLNETAERFANDVLVIGTDKDDHDADNLYNFHRSFLRMALLYEDLREAIKYEDGPRVIQHWRMWLLYFLATKRSNYSNEAANLLANLKAVFSKRLAYIVTHNRAVNSLGIPGHGKAIDMAVEHHNLVIKTALRSSGGSITLHHLRVISLASQLLHDAALLCDQEVHAPHVGTRHKGKKVLKKTSK